MSSFWYNKLDIYRALRYSIIYIRRKPCNRLRINMCFSIYCKKNTSN